MVNREREPQQGATGDPESLAPGGIGRLGFILGLVPLAAVGFLLVAIQNVWLYALALAVYATLLLLLYGSRLRNMGMQPRLAITIFVPILNIILFARCLFVPQRQKRDPTTGEEIAFGVSIVWIVAVLVLAVTRMSTSGVFMPELASAHGGQIDFAVGLVHWLMFILFVVWSALFLYILVRFRGRRHPKADYRGVQSHASSYAEVGVALAEVVLLVFFSIPLYSERVDDLPPADQAQVVRVVGEQFAWNVHYPGPDGIFGRTAIELVDAETNPLGLDRDDPAAKDDVTAINQLHLPVDKPALIYLSSKDVIHSFYLPEMRVKQDAIPGMEVAVWFVPTVTTEEMRQRRGEEGYSYEIGCAQLCGIGHYRMRGFLTIETQEGFDAWMAEQEEALQQEDEGGFWS